MVVSRATAALKAGFDLIFCIGETLHQFEHNETDAVLARQLLALVGLEVDKRPPLSKIIIAYEPVWAIGTGKVASLAQIERAHNLVREIWEDNSEESCPLILYGGSVAPDNFAEIIASKQVDGALVGGASLSSEKFSKLIEISEKNP